MRIQPIGLVSTIALSALVSACGSISMQNDGGGGQGGAAGHGGQGGGGGQDGGSACRNLDETSCRARTDCAVGTCSLCGGTPQFAGCYDPAHESPPACLGIACPAPCSSITDQASCQARADCVVRTCPDCNGGSYFSACTTPNAGYNCPAISCPAPSCSQVTTQAACDARADCHSVFIDPGTCGCASSGCCAHFSRCADGGKAICKAPSGFACAIAQPYCESPYVVSYANSCYEGCVAQTECAP
ncbi:MAG TPA: hypothetical protein VKQ32_18780 [Polyangia bacterium]|nr:hypothetical protein [Polyangia bacterium]